MTTTTSQPPVRIGLVGGGLMGRELASALGRWFMLKDFPVGAELVAVADPVPPAREWFRQVPSVQLLAETAEELAASPEVDVVYVAVPHHLHLPVYEAVLRAGKDLLAEKPFGIDLAAAERIGAIARETDRFVRCSSEFPFLPGAQAVWRFIRDRAYGTPLEVRAGFHHSSDLDPTKPINWKRQVRTCGEIGVMGDLGMHVVHVPFRAGWFPRAVYAQLQNVVRERPDGKGGRAVCDTWDNATLHTEVTIDGAEVPMRLETKRLAPTETNTWYLEVIGTEAGVRYSTKTPKTLWRYRRGNDQAWEAVDLGSQGAFPTYTGGIFEVGFNDCFQQMWAAYLLERAGSLGERFGCVTPDEAVVSHRLFAAALASQKTRQAVRLRE